MGFAFFGAITFFLAVWTGAYFVNVLLHELGHAIPVLCWSRKPVSIFIGSFGVESGSFRLKIGRLTVFITYNPLRWIKGLCRPGESLSVNKQIFYIALGPVTSLLVGTSCWLLLKQEDMEGRAFAILMPIMIVGFLFTLFSVIPSGRMIITGSGKATYNDASLILQLWRSRKLPAEYWKAAEYVKAEQYEEAAVLLDALVDKEPKQAAVLRFAVGVHLKSRHFERAAALMTMVREEFGVSADDHVNAGYLQIMKYQFEEATRSFSNALTHRPNHPMALNNYGYALVALDKAGEAIPFYEQAIAANPHWAPPYNGRGWAKMKLGQWEEGLADVRHSLKIGDKDADAHRLLGLYYLEMGALEEARESFLKARSMDEHLLFLDEAMAELERREAASGQPG